MKAPVMTPVKAEHVRANLFLIVDLTSNDARLLVCLKDATMERQDKMLEYIADDEVFIMYFDEDEGQNFLPMSAIQKDIPTVMNWYKCPTCGGWKDYDSLQCHRCTPMFRELWYTDQRRDFENPWN